MLFIAAAFSIALTPSLVFAQHDQASAPYRFRISWGGGQNQAWQGSLFVKTGTLSDIAPLGLNRDSSVTALLTSTNNIAITQRSPTSYDGFDFSIFGSDESTIDIELNAMDGSGAQWQKSIRIDALLDDGLNEALDDLGHGISMRAFLAIRFKSTSNAIIWSFPRESRFRLPLRENECRCVRRNLRAG